MKAEERVSIFSGGLPPKTHPAVLENVSSSVSYKSALLL
jgi:hypothetical protein